ncbi:MAG: DUF3078 domain-containing protein [Flavobacteriales bacterium]|nr:DUF3078 domain-containing protein [Flavobacteriales bacterium]
MKKKFITALLMVLGLSVFAQDPTLEQKEKELEAAKAKLAEAQAKVNQIAAEVEALKPIVKWEKGNLLAVNFNQGSFTNWSLGGVNAISVAALGNAFANYKYGKWTWDNNLDLAYGLLRNKGESVRKNEDKIDFQTKVGRRATDKLSWASIARFESQFAEGFDFANPDENRPVLSRFMAPAYLKFSVGIDYKPNKYLSMYISPAAGKWTFVNDDSIAAMHLYIPTTSVNANRRGEFGALTSFIYQNKAIVKNIGVRSSLELFNNFTDLNRPNRRNIDVDWQTRFDWKLNKYLGMTLFGHVKYDDDTRIEFDPEGQPGKVGPRTQFKELFGVGFSYKF